MIALAWSRIYVYPAPCDLRKGFNGLSGLVETALAHDVRSGAVFVFINRRRTSAKLLHWDGTGLVIVQKRLAQGRFAKVWDTERRRHGRIVLRPSELAQLFEGGPVVLSEKHRRRRAA